MRYAITLGLAFLIGCQGAGDPVLDLVTVRDSAGVEIVENNAPPAGLREVWHVDTAPVTRIGGDASDPNQQFTSVTVAARLSDGRVAIALNGQLNYFDSTGKYITSGTRRGEGPGEFINISKVYRLGGDTLAVVGAARRRKVVKLSPGGEIVSESVVDCEKLALMPLACNVDPLPDGSMLFIGPDSTIPYSATHRPEIRYPDNSSSVGDGHTRSLSRLFIIPPSFDRKLPTAIESNIEYFDLPHRDGGATMIYHLFYSRRSRFVIGGTPLRLASARNPEYVVHIWGLDGKLERSIRYAGGRRTPTEAEKADNLAQLEKMLRDDERGVSLAQALEAAPVPDSVPAVVALHLSLDNELLVQREGSFPSHPSHLFDVFDSSGRLLGMLRLPPRSKLLEVGRDYVLVEQIQASEEPHVLVLRMRR